MDPKKSLPQTMSASRRAFFRVSPSEAFSIASGEGRQSVLPDFEGVDVSVYGIGFLVEDPEAQLLIPGLILKDLRFQLDGRTIVADGRIQHRQLERPAKGEKPARYKVGVEFLDLPSEDVFFLSEYVVKEGSVPRRPVAVPVGTEKKPARETRKKAAAKKSVRAQPKKSKKATAKKAKAPLKKAPKKKAKASAKKASPKKGVKAAAKGARKARSKVARRKPARRRSR